MQTRISLFSAAYILLQAGLASAQVMPRYKNYIASLNEESKEIISKNPNKKALVRRHLQKLGLTVLRELPLEETYLVRLNDRRIFLKKKSNNIASYFNYFEPDYEINESDIDIDEDGPVTSAATFPNDPELQTLNSWGLDEYYGSNAVNAWDVSTGGSDSVIGVLGTGIDLSHSDLAPNIWIDPSPSSSNKKETTQGFNFYNSSIPNPPTDDHGITTFAAGIIAAKGNNTVGTAGINWSGKLMAIKVAGSNGTSISSTISQVVDGIDYAIRKKNAGAKVAAIFNFLAFTTDSSNALKTKIEQAGTAGILFVTAAGDAARNLDTQTVIPSSLNLGNMITVGSYFGVLNPAKSPHFSDIYYSAVPANSPYATYNANYGAVKVHLAAPGERVRSTWRGNSYQDFAGTTVSAAYVAGAISLLKAYRPELTMTELRNAIVNNVRVYNTELNGRVSTKGVLDVYKSINSVRKVIPGDYDLDGDVDGADFLVWQRNFGQTGNNPADGNKDGVVNAADYTVWRDNYGRTS